MEKAQKIIFYLAVFTVFLYILRIFGIIKIEGGQILGYAFIFYGISAVYLSFGQNERATLLLGSVFFCLGVLLFLFSNFSFPSFGMVIFPAVLMTVSVSSFILYLDDTRNKVFLYSAAGFLLVTLAIAKIWGVISFSTFFISAWTTILGYWPIVLIFLFVLFLLRERDF